MQVYTTISSVRRVQSWTFLLIKSPKANFIGFLIILAKRNWLWLSFGLK